jgi:hypothetical protein
MTTSEKGAAAADDKLEWLRSELIGKDVEFDTPFGRRALTYADQTASGRSLRYIEDYLRGFTYYIKPQLLSSVICDITVERNIQKKNLLNVRNLRIIIFRIYRQKKFYPSKKSKFCLPHCVVVPVAVGR